MAVEKDLVLIYLEDKPLAFARIESILPDSKKDWYHVRLLLLQIPLQVVLCKRLRIHDERQAHAVGKN